MQEFFKNDFTQDRWLKAAQKNAFALLGKQRFEHAAAFFLLAGKIRDAIEVIINNLHDIQLALLIARLYNDDEQNLVDQLLNREILSKSHGDPFYRSMAYWLMKDYERSLNTLLENETFGQQQSILIFYDYLKQHPLVLRTKQLADEKHHHSSNNFAIERRFHFQTAYNYLKMGCPLLALEILAKLPAHIVLSDGDRTPVETNNDHSTKAVDLVDWSQPVSKKIDDDELTLDWDVDDDEKQDEPKKETNMEQSVPIVDEKQGKQQFDTIGQYMKLICCLKIIVEEMATLATGFEVAGGQLR
jgi:DmX-like protein